MHGILEDQHPFFTAIKVIGASEERTQRPQEVLRRPFKEHILVRSHSLNFHIQPRKDFDLDKFNVHHLLYTADLQGHLDSTTPATRWPALSFVYIWLSSFINNSNICKVKPNGN
ncbi:hypothetical protein TNCV_1142291 [Trichonephila clavipes]|nr:hypothetical protein TNCV_1142291 [Trichonephila clavipes]